MTKNDGGRGPAHRPRVTKPRRVRGGDRQCLDELVDEYERRLILVALTAAEGNQRWAALCLRVRTTSLHEKMKRLGISVGRARQNGRARPEEPVVASTAEPRAAEGEADSSQAPPLRLVGTDEKG